MYGRLSHAKIKAGNRKQVEAILEQLGQQTAELPHVKHWIGLLTDNDEIMVIGIYDSVASRDATEAINRQRWDTVKHLIAGPPTVKHIDGVVWPNLGGTRG